MAILQEGTAKWRCLLARHGSISRVLSSTVIYLNPKLLVGFSRLLGTVGQTYCPSTALLRIEFTSFIRVLLEMLFPETADLLPHLCSLEILKYTKYVCNLQRLICVNISGCSRKIFSAKHPLGFVYEAPDLCLHKLGALLPHLFTLTLRRYISVALVLGSPPAGVTRYPCPVEPGLSSPGSRWGSGRDCPTRSRKYCTARNPTCQTSCKIFYLCIY